MMGLDRLTFVQSVEVDAAPELLARLRVARQVGDPARAAELVDELMDDPWWAAVMQAGMAARIARARLATVSEA